MLSKQSTKHLLASLKREAARKRVKGGERKLTFAEFFARMSPNYIYPSHLSELVDAFERIARGETVEMVVTVPPRHSKTETVMHGIAWLLSMRPELEVIFGCYGADLANEKSRIVRGYCEQAGVDFSEDSNQVGRWKTKRGGGFLAGGVGGGQTGFGGDVIVIDDPYRNFADASSSAYRRRVEEWFAGVIYTRRSPGASTIIIQTRWHPQDIAANRIAKGWESLKKPALDDDGNALWPERYSVEELAKIRGEISEYVWSALYQGEPRPREGAIFKDVHPYADLPPGCSFHVGLDVAYSSKTSADYSVAVVLAKHGAGSSARFYVVDMLRVQEQATTFVPKLRALMSKHGALSALWYASGTEAGAAHHIQSLGANVVCRPPKGDKLVRALPASALWEHGRLLVPANAPWLNAFVSEVCSFTGSGDEHDDIVDALAAAVDAAASGLTGSVTTGGRPHETRELGPRTAGARNLKW